MLFPTVSFSAGLSPTIGTAIGVALGIVGLRLTSFDSTDDGLHFQPDRYIGTIVLLLFVGRMIYRFVRIGGVAGVAASSAANAPVAQLWTRSPLTTILLFVMLGYYVSYYALIWYRGRELSRAAEQPGAA